MKTFFTVGTLEYSCRWQWQPCCTKKASACEYPCTTNQQSMSSKAPDHRHQMILRRQRVSLSPAKWNDYKYEFQTSMNIRDKFIKLSRVCTYQQYLICVNGWHKNKYARIETVWPTRIGSCRELLSFKEFITILYNLDLVK